MMFFKSKAKTVAADQKKSSGPQEIFTRADRYRVRAPMRFRRTGHMGWLSATTINLSKSGVLFITDTTLPAGTSIEVEITLPQKGPGHQPKLLSASAVVVGDRESERGDKGSRIAAKILRCAV